MNCFILTSLFLLLVAFSEGNDNDGEWVPDTADISEKDDSDRNDSWDWEGQESVNGTEASNEELYEDIFVRNQVNPKLKVGEEDTSKYHQICQDLFNNTANVSGVVLLGCSVQCVQNLIYQDGGFIVYATVPLGIPVLIQDGEKCGLSSKCLKGVCYRSDDLQQCQEQLESEPLTLIKYEHCVKVCIGGQRRKAYIKVQDGISCGFFGKCLSGKCRIFYHFG